MSLAGRVGKKHHPSGSFTSSHSVHLQDEVDEVLERRVVHVRYVPAAPADVIPNAVLRNAVQRLVESVE
jgi:hypothetical protein